MIAISWAIMNGFDLPKSKKWFFNSFCVIKIQLQIRRIAINRNLIIDAVIYLSLSLECINHYVPSTKIPIELNSKWYEGEYIVICAHITKELHAFNYPRRIHAIKLFKHIIQNQRNCAISTTKSIGFMGKSFCSTVSARWDRR